MSSVWRPVPGYEGFYEASAGGVIRSVPRVVTQYNARAGRTVPLRRAGKVLAGAPRGRDGRGAVSLSRGGITLTCAVHVLVCEAFHGPRPDGMQVCHNNGNRVDNRAANLRWDTPTSNQADRVLHGTNLCGEGVSTAKLTEAGVLLIRGGMRRAEATRLFGIGHTQFHRVKRGESWAHVTIASVFGAERGVKFSDEVPA